MQVVVVLWLLSGLGCRSDRHRFCRGTGAGGGHCCGGWTHCGVVVTVSSLAGAGGDDRHRCRSTGCDAHPLLHMVKESSPCHLWLALVVMVVWLSVVVLVVMVFPLLHIIIVCLLMGV